MGSDFNYDYEKKKELCNRLNLNEEEYKKFETEIENYDRLVLMNHYNFIDLLLKALGPPIETITNIFNAFSLINEINNKNDYDSKDGQGSAYKKISAFFYKERNRVPYNVNTRGILWRDNLEIKRKTCKSTIWPEKNKGWKGKR